MNPFKITKRCQSYRLRTNETIKGTTINFNLNSLLLRYSFTAKFPDETLAKIET